MKHAEDLFEVKSDLLLPCPGSAQGIGRHNEASGDRPVNCFAAAMLLDAPTPFCDNFLLADHSSTDKGDLVSVAPAQSIRS